MLAKILFGIFIVICTITDIRKRRVYFEILIPFAIAGVALQFIEPSLSLFELLGGVALGGVLMGISVLTSGKIGLGDGLVFVVCGIYLGIFTSLWVLMIAAFLSALVSVGLLITKAARKESELAFVPFVMISYFVVLIF
ncbi:MAG: prepilin peptidase [Lachnospiraceae bacterium]|nr:prepilin peptidase [Lachnospiraceae bacterium]